MNLTDFLTSAEWQSIAAAFGLTDDDAIGYRAAFDDAQRLGLAAFGDTVLAEHKAVVALARAGGHPDETLQRRLQARRDVHEVLVEWQTHNLLASHAGPQQ